MSTSRIDDAALIAQGDERAFNHFYERHKAAVYGLAGQILGEPSAAEETTLDVFVQIWRHAPDYRSQTASARVSFIGNRKYQVGYDQRTRT